MLKRDKLNDRILQKRVRDAGLSNIQLPFDLDPRSQSVNVSRSQAPGRVH